jgi:hypothetical protein
MPTVYASTLKSARMQAVISAIDAQASAGSLEIGTSGMMSVLIAFVLSKPSFTLSGTVITMAGMPKSGTASGTGSAGSAQIKDGAGNIIVSGLTVDLAGADIILNATEITSGDLVALSSATISHG